jgi:VIT1/CCC1 family predicted Fe2+/Mn2+ transporter
MKISKFSLGATAAITTSMGLIAGLSQGDSAKKEIITGLLIIAIVDNLSDSLGIHIYKESEGVPKRETNLFTYGNYLTRLVIALTFVLIVLLFPSPTALIISSIWGLSILAILSYSIAIRKRKNPWWEIIWHLLVALMVIAGSKLLGKLISKMVI